MSSGEVLFILAFIVLPTAILVSSVWAIIFVRRRPDRIEAPEARAIEQVDEDQDSSLDQTAVLATTPAATNDDLPITEHDVIVITDEAPVIEEPLTVEEPETVQPADADPDVPVQPDLLETPAEEPIVLQSTEDLGDVVETLRDMDLVIEQEPAAPEPEPEPEPQRVEETPQREHEVPEAEAVEFYETSELPVVTHTEQKEVPQPIDVAPDEQPAADRGGSGWRRRRQQVKLLPGDTEAPRARGRNREAQRQVPQLNRAARKRDDARNLPPESDSDQDATPGRS